MPPKIVPMTIKGVLRPCLVATVYPKSTIQ